MEALIAMLATRLKSCYKRAIESLRPTFEQFNCTVRLEKVLVKTEDEARRYNLTSSPIIRIGKLHFAPGHDPNLGEDRTWKWNGQTLKTLSKQLLMEVILAAYSGVVDVKETTEISQYVLKYLNGKVKSSACCPNK